MQTQVEYSKTVVSKMSKIMISDAKWHIWPSVDMRNGMLWSGRPMWQPLGFTRILLLMLLNRFSSSDHWSPIIIMGSLSQSIDGVVDKLPDGSATATIITMTIVSLFICL